MLKTLISLQLWLVMFTGNFRVKSFRIGDASGVFPIDDQTLTYRQDFIEKFNSLPEVEQYPWQLKNILPAVLVAGRDAGHLTADGAKLLDPSGTLQAGSLMAPQKGCRNWNGWN